MKAWRGVQRHLAPFATSRATPGIAATAPSGMRTQALIGRDRGPYNWESATGECGKCVYARNALHAGSAVRPACLLAVRKVRTVERFVR